MNKGRVRMPLSPCAYLRRCAVLVLAALATAAVAATEPVGKVAIGDIAPSALGENRDGADINAKDYAGKVLVVTFWATWCAPCLKELPVLEALQRAGKTSVQVVAINIEDRDQYRAALRVMTPFTLNVAHDPGKFAANAYGVKGIPHLVIIGRDGKVRNVHRGYNEDMLDRILAEINAALAAR